MRKYCFYLIIVALSLYPHIEIHAQNMDKLSVGGGVMAENGEPLIGVNVYIKHNTAIGVTTDGDGKFILGNIPKNSSIVFSYMGYNDFELILTKSNENLKITLEANIDVLDQVIVVGRGTQRKITTTGAVTSINIEALQVPATSTSNMLAGRVPGIISVSRSGEPGEDVSEFWIRGINTFGANSSALVLIDGVEGNLDDVEPSDMASFSILKDASSTAVYGIRGANGVVVITTKKGVAGELKVNFKVNRTYTQCARLPRYVNAVDYSNLANEAREVRGLATKYSATDLKLFETGLDPDMHPNINWRDVILKNHSYYSNYNLNISGGGINARYFMSLAYKNKESVFKQDNSATKYDVDLNYKQYNFRANVDVNMTKTMIVSLNMNDVISLKNSPGYSDNNQLWAAQANLTPVTVPIKYSNGQLAAYGSSGNQITPYVLLNYTGYERVSKNTVNLKLNIAQDLNVITKGLDLNAMFSYTSYGKHISRRYKMPALYYASGRQNDGTLITTKTVSKTDATYTQSALVERQIFYEIKLNYNRLFDEKHRITGLVDVFRQDERTSDGNSYDDVIPERFQTISGRATYSFKDTYLFELNAGYSGSENFKPGEQYGFFPAFSMGWVPTQYEWAKENISFFSYFKIRASWGQVGNGDTDERFPYLSLMSSGSNDWGKILTESKVGVDNLSWETTTKYDVGIDAKFFKDRFDLTIDGYYSQARDIYQQRTTIPEEVGVARSPWINAGAMNSWGADGNISYTQPIGNNNLLTLRANFTFSKNEIKHWEQTGINYPYQSYAGYSYGVQRGLVALGLFKDEDDIASSPTQTFMSDYMPGDIKYKDVNGDGVVDEDDEVPLDYSDIPQLEYGFAVEYVWKNWTFSVLFSGQKNVSYFLGGDGYYPFNGGEEGNVLNIVNNQENRWTPASYSGTKETENPNARFPRLTYGDNENNNQNSTFWLADASFLRLKNAEIAYRFNKYWLSKHGLSNATISLTGTNLAIWDHVKLWDPEQASSNGSVYPLQKYYTLQLNIAF